MITVHMIGNAHLDPAWLWRRSDGVDAALATARSACDRLEEHADFVFTCSASWFHEQVERHDPALFERVRRFVEAGRWRIVGGMVIEPDCNLPSPASFARQLDVGQRWFQEHFGRAATVGYNIDSFGHTAYLPRFLRKVGIDSYVFMRPGPEERDLPARLFRWRSPDGREVTAFRIAGAYTTAAADLREHVERALTLLPEGIDQTMCFYGVGDHGGGPTNAQIEWIAAHAEGIEGVRLAFSHPQAFFDAIASQIEGLPVVEGELQHHAIGCYSVERRIKVAMRRAQGRLVQAAQTLRALPDAAPPDAREALDAAWRKVLFNQFHDILGGTCIEPESRRAAGEMTDAEAAADGVITTATRRAFRAEAEPGTHKIVVFNPADRPFQGWVEHEPWLAPGREGDLRLLSEDDRTIETQAIDPLSMTGARRLLFRTRVPARGRRVLRIVAAPDEPADGQDDAAILPPEGLTVDPRALGNGAIRADLRRDGIEIGRWRLRLEVCDDPTDTWTHCHGGASRFDGAVLGPISWRLPADVVERGPLRAALRVRGGFGRCRVWCRAALCRGEPLLRLHLRVVWAEVRRRLRLRVDAPGSIIERTDLVSGGPQDRPIDALEYPVSGGMLLGTEGDRLAIVAPEVFSAGVEPGAVNLTLLRSPYAAHHDPFPAADRPDQPVTDSGSHDLTLLLWPGCGADIGAVERLAGQMLMPPIAWDLTG